MSFMEFLDFFGPKSYRGSGNAKICQKISCVPSVCDLKEEHYPEFCIVVE
jgi:hypothetical protein